MPDRAPRPFLKTKSRSVALLTPEGVTVEFVIPPLSTRYVAFVLDMMLIIFVIIAALLGAVAMSTLIGSDLPLAFGMLLWFALFNLYFPFCEYRWSATLGKKALGIRVIDRRGAPLSLEAILTRNVLRFVEVWIPLAYMFDLAGSLTESAPDWAGLAAFLWSVGIILFPRFNKRRLRIGDYLGGTMVVVAPKAVLLPDLAQAGAASRFQFTSAQLSVYGRVELQVLEDLLRRPSGDVEKVIHKVASKVRIRIGFEEMISRRDSREFLRAFYRAQREELERLMSLGQGRETKLDSAAGQEKIPSRRANSRIETKR